MDTFDNQDKLMTKSTRKAQLEEARVQAIRAALIEGERSGLSAHTPESIRAQVKARRVQTGSCGD
jgi:hypothetical protein